MHPRNFGVQPRAGLNREDRLVLVTGPGDPRAVKRGQKVGFAGHGLVQNLEQVADPPDHLVDVGLFQDKWRG